MAYENYYRKIVLEKLLQEVKQAVQQHFKRYALLPVMVPNLSLNDTMKELGRYRGNDMLIEISTSFVFNHPWYAVVDVLLHELAHHLKHVFYPAVAESMHGPMFQKYCRILGANPHASGNYPPLDETLSMDADSNALSPMEQRIQKLLALSTSPNEHEAQQALLKARELMAKHGIEQERVEDDSNDPYISMYVEPVFPGFRGGREYITHEESKLNHLLLEFYDIKVLLMGQCPTMATSTKDYLREMISLNGQRSKVKIANYVRHYIANYIRQNIGCDYNSNSRQCRDWALGVMEGFAEVLRQQNDAPEMHALVETSNAALNEFYHARYPRTHTVSPRSITVSEKQRENGRQVGRKLHINPGMEGNTSGPLALK